MMMMMMVLREPEQPPTPASFHLRSSGTTFSGSASGRVVGSLVRMCVCVCECAGAFVPGILVGMIRGTTELLGAERQADR